MQNLPNIQTSLAVVNRLKLMDSGAIHLMGSLPLDAEDRNGSYCYTKVTFQIALSNEEDIKVAFLPL